MYGKPVLWHLHEPGIDDGIKKFERGVVQHPMMLRKLAKDALQREREVGEGIRLMVSSLRRERRSNAQRGHSQRLRNAVTGTKKNTTAQEDSGRPTALTFIGVIPLVGMGLLIGLNDEMKEEFFSFWGKGNNTEDTQSS